MSKFLILRDGDRIIRDAECRKLAGNISRTTLYRWERDGKWPKSVPLGANSKGYWLSEVLTTLESRRPSNAAA